MKIPTTFILISSLALWPAIAGASSANNTNVDKFYRPVKSNDLVTKLPPRLNQDKNFGRNSAFFSSENQGCPEEINIGSVDEDTDIFGDIDIEVYIGDDVFIDCAGF